MSTGGWEWNNLPYLHERDPAPKDVVASTCQHCGNERIPYTRKIGGSMCSALINLARLHRDGTVPFYDGDSITIDGEEGIWWPRNAFMRDYQGEKITGGWQGYFRFWRLTESVGRTIDSGSSFHRLTSFGWAFITGGAEIPSAAVEIRQQVQFYRGPMITFRDCLDSSRRFDFTKLLEEAGLT